MPRSFVLLVLTTLVGCATNFAPKPLPPDHPASVQAEEAPRSGTRRLIEKDELSRKTGMQLARKDVPNPDFQDSGMSHDMSKMEGMDHSKMPGMDHSKMKEMAMPSASPTESPAAKEAVETEMKAKSEAAKGDKKPGDKSVESPPAAAVYTCTMHPEVNLPAAGKCPKCRMTLVQKEGGAK